MSYVWYLWFFELDDGPIVKKVGSPIMGGYWVSTDGKNKHINK